MEDYNEALDFTSSPKNQTSEAPALDLSCKKSQDDPSMSYSLSPPSSENRSLSPSSEIHVDHQAHHHNSSFNEEQKSPYEGRTYMVTPPSESESPKKLKYPPIYPDFDSPIGEMSHRYSMMPMNLPIQVGPVLPPLLASQNGGTVRQMHIPVTTTMTSSMQEISAPLQSPDMGKKTPRPFKAYPKDPLSLAMGPEMMYDQNSNEAYSEFRKRMLESVRRTNEGTNIKMRRVSKSPGLPTSTMDEKDAAYWERRRKNNEAAKRSRDARRAKEDEIAIRAAFLEQENLKLKYELVALRQEHQKLRCMVYTS